MRDVSGKSGLVLRLSRRLRPLCVAIGVLISLVFPAAYYAVGLVALRDAARVEAGHLAGQLRPVLLADRALIRVIDEFLKHEDAMRVLVLDQTGRPVVKQETAAGPGWWSWYGPTGAVALVANDRALGSVQIAMSQNVLLARTLLFLLISVATGLGLALGVYRLAVNAISEAARHLQAHHDTVRILADNAGIPETLPRLLAALATATRWDLGEVWMLDASANLLRRGESWAAVPEAARFEAGSRPITVGPGEGLAGRVWVSGQAAWIADLATDRHFVNPAATGPPGRRAAFAFPILGPRGILGVMVFFSRVVRPADDEVLALAGDIGTLIGAFIARKQDEEEIGRQRDALYQTEKLAATGQLLAGIAHELNNPLTVVKGRATLLRQRLGGHPLAAPLEKIEEAAERCARIVRNFLAMARQLKPERRAVDVNRVVREAIELLAYQLRVDEVDVALRLAADVPSVCADPHQLHQVAVNLISNAHHAMRQTPLPRRVTITTRHDAPRRRVTLTVEDSGPGVPPEIQQRIFEPFFTTKPLGEGTGLGLSLCRGIVEKHGGTIRVVGGRDGGAGFEVELPVDVPAESDGSPAPHVAPGGGRAILVVDDEPDVAGLIAELLAVDGHRVDTVLNGAAALASIDHRQYDAIVCDLRMPVLDGRGLYNALQRRNGSLCRRIVFLTGDTLSAEAARFLEDTGAPTLIKPFDPEGLRKVIAQTLSSNETGGSPDPSGREW